jgi:hypothetical protein
MNGWWRLGVVLTLPVSLLAGFIGWDTDRSVSFYGNTPSDLVDVDAYIRTERLWAAHKDEEELAGCDAPTARIYTQPDQTFSIRCEKTSDARIWRGMNWAAIPFIVLWVIGTLIAWVYQGFRPPAAKNRT